MPLTTAQIDSNITARQRHTLETETLREMVDFMSQKAVVTHNMILGTAGSDWVVIPWACTITKIYSVIDGALATADEAITFELGGTAVTGAAITITQSGSAAGDIDSSTPTALNTVTAGQAIEIVTDGGNSNAATATFTFLLTMT